MARKLTEKDIAEIKQRYAKGKSLSEIARKKKVSPALIYYWINDKYRKKSNKYSRKYSIRLYKEGRLWHQLNPKKYRKYDRNYTNIRYKNDPEFRERRRIARQKYYSMRKAQKTLGMGNKL